LEPRFSRPDDTPAEEPVDFERRSQIDAVVQEAELAHAVAADDESCHRPEFETGQQLQTVTGRLDLFGDASIVIYPTPGHTPGHQLVRAITTGGPAILAGDACNLRQSLDELRLPTHTHDSAAVPQHVARLL